jgi:hypothetical protein
MPAWNFRDRTDSEVTDRSQNRYSFFSIANDNQVHIFTQQMKFAVAWQAAAIINLFMLLHLPQREISIGNHSLN